jgi:hypothetical protein
VLAGVLACLFGILGIFTLAIVFVPLAAVCSVIGMLLGLFGRSGSGFGLSLVGGFLTAAGFAVSPSLWLIFGGLLTTVHFWQPSVPPSKPVAVASNPPPHAVPPLVFAAKETEAAANECRAKKHNGIFQTSEQVARCTADRMMQAFSDAGYRNMDLIAQLGAARISLAEMIDRNLITDAEAQLQFSKKVAEVKEIERQRNSASK